ncbi:MAG: Nif11-like leader peptide family natural product precursor [Chlorobiaceae bacterium]|nr:Nif11-like leader peptide family natural product precursor [Chlorobiaceae bacterium]
MSLEQAKACIEKMKSDESFRKDILSLDDIDLRVRAVNDAGYSCTAEELQQVSSKLMPESFEAVSGGSWCTISDGYFMDNHLLFSREKEGE